MAMLPIQDIEIITKHGRRFAVQLKKMEATLFECELAALELGPQSLGDSTYRPCTKGSSAVSAFQYLVDSLRTRLAKLDANDDILTVDNPCNAELISPAEQRLVLGPGIAIHLNHVAI